LDHWYTEQIDSINKIYLDKKQQLENFCIQSKNEFEIYKTRKTKQLKENLLKQVKHVLKQKQIHIDDLNEMKFKLNDIERGLDELKQLMIDIHYDPSKIDIQIIKRRYVEASKVCDEIFDH
jgi:conjugal transfer/entry exclusion protein